MSASDLIATYGAVLASILAVVQIAQWRSSTRALRVKWYGIEEFGADSHLEGSITNVSNHWIFIEDVFVGSSFRPWKRFWREVSYEGISVGVSEHYPKSERADGLLKPGAMIEFSTHRSQLKEHGNLPGFSLGFRRRHVLWINHSASDRTLFVRVP